MPEPIPLDSNQHEQLSSLNADHIVYLGIFNADRFRTKIESWLPKLDLDGTHLVIGDNCSSDTSLSWISELVKKMNVQYTVISNKRNYGGYGGFAVNFVRFPSTKWFTTLHQDDRYRADHIQKHRAVLSSQHSKPGMICSEYESVLPNGKKVAYPRANWLLGKSPDIATVFLANLRNHAYPFSGATFSREIFEKFPIPWYSSAFPDTEIVLKMCAEYRVVFAAGLTVEYMENPLSESHSLSPAQREFGSFQALIRVFAHDNFAKVCHSVAIPDRRGFILSLIEGIAVRFKDEILRRLMTQFALEQSAQHLGVFSDLAKELAKGYKSVQDIRAVEVLASMGEFESSELCEESHLPNASESKPNSNVKYHKVYLFFGLLPLGARKVVFRLMTRSAFLRHKMRAWDFDWKKD